ncbi:putative sugar kinase [Candidatus Gugararchaeum adminiculabundum]|nr:putative sugar kinase [Candidatus Gugararchaeum adminiculabundum]
MAKSEVVTIGHILYDTRCYVDGFPSPSRTTFTQKPIATGCGGSAANTAVNLCRLGKKASMIGRIGDDFTGRQLLHELEKKGVGTAGIQKSKGTHTGISIVLIDKNAEVEVIEDVGANEPLALGKEAEKAIKAAKHLHLTGTSIKALEKASAIAEKAGTTVSFDPGRSKSHLGKKGLGKILENVDYLILNRAELGRITKAWNPLTGARELVKEFNLSCVIKSGEKPIIFESRHEHFSVYPVHLKPIDTIGAGDAFSAGFICGLLEGKKHIDCVKLGAACSAAKILRQGAQSLPPRKDVEKFLKRVK